MEMDDFVETSDVEELQELEEEGRRAPSSSSQRHDSFSPRKRVKVCLIFCVSFPTYVSSKLFHESLNDDETFQPHSGSQTLEAIHYSNESALKPTAVTINPSTTPTNSPPTYLRRLFSPELYSPAKSPISARNLLKDDNDDELLFFTPVKSFDLNRTLSPLTPSPKSLVSDTVDRDVIYDLSQSPFQDLPALSSSPGSPLQAPPPPPDAPEHPEAIQDQLQDGPRYPLRRRKAAQLKPYTVDQLKYKQALKSNPDAIVKFKNLDLRNHHHHPEDHYEEDGETQKEDAFIDDGNNGEDGDWEERERRFYQRREDDRRKETPGQALSERRQVSFPEILQDLSSTDEEEANEKHTLSKEARKIVKERERQWEIQKREERRKEQEQSRQQLLLNPKPFPTFNRKPSNVEAPSDDRSTLEDVCRFYVNIFHILLNI